MVSIPPQKTGDTRSTQVTPISQRLMRTGFPTTLAAIILLIGVLAIVATPEHWPVPEAPPRQGEALDRTQLMVNRKAVHSAEAMSHLIREPQNAWSNIAYLAGGSLLLCSVVSSRTVRLIGIALIGVGIGSFLYHASASRTLRHLDVGGMYWVLLSATLHSMGSMFPRFGARTDRHGMAMGILTLALATAGAAARNVTVAGTKPLALDIIIVASAASIIAALLITGFRRRTRGAVLGCVASLSAFGAAIVFQIGDRPGGFLCDPASPIQAHALWHCLSALALVAAVRMIDSPASFGRLPTAQTSPGGPAQDPRVEGILPSHANAKSEV